MTQAIYFFTANKWRLTKEGEVLASSSRISIYGGLNSNYGLDSVKDRIVIDIISTISVSPPSLCRQNPQSFFWQPLHPTQRRPHLSWCCCDLSTWQLGVLKLTSGAGPDCVFVTSNQKSVCYVMLYFDVSKLNKCYIWKPGRHNCCITIIQLFDEQDDGIAAITFCRNIQSYIYKYLFLKSRRAELQQSHFAFCRNIWKSLQKKVFKEGR